MYFKWTIYQWHDYSLTFDQECIKERLGLICMPKMNEKTSVACFFSALQKTVLIPSMYFANYSKKTCWSAKFVGPLKHFEFACMTTLSPETVSIALCQCSIIDIQVPPVLNQPKKAEILAQN